MGAKGSVLKQEISEKILATFPGSFLYNNGKEIRINGVENGEQLQVKVVLTTAKTPVEGGEETVVSSVNKVETANIEKEKLPQEPSDDEKERLKMLLDKLGFSEV